MEAIIKYVVGEMRVIAEAPAIFTIALLVLSAAVWWAMDWRYGSIINNQGSEIKLLERQKAEASPVPKPGALADRAQLRLHVYGDTRLPDRLAAANIWRWYYMHEVLVMMNQDGSKNREILTSKLFISFDQPVSVGTMTVRADKPLPHYEVKEFNNRFAIIAFLEAVPECNLEIDVIP
jgi:hypothetical protein